MNKELKGMKATNIFIMFLLLFGLSVSSVNAQTKAKFNYAAQKKFIPTELGRAYLGMSFKDFAKTINLQGAEADGRFQWLELEIPFDKGNAESLAVKIHGLSEEEKEILIQKRNVKRKNGTDIWEEEIKWIDVSKIPAKGFIYEIKVRFKNGFDLKSYALKMFGATKEVYKKGDEYHIYDMQWTKKTTDGLDWLVRYHEASNTLQLCGRIKETEWDISG